MGLFGWLLLAAFLWFVILRIVNLAGHAKVRSDQADRVRSYLRDAHRDDL